MAIHEQSTFNMGEIIRASKEQRARNPAQKTRAPVKTTDGNILNHAANIESAHHGDYVQTDDGVGAIVIDHDEQLKKMQEADKTGKALMELINSPGLISDANAYIPNYGEDAPEGYNPGEHWIQENPYDPKAETLRKIKKGFSGLTYGVNGLVNISSDEGKLVDEALEKIRTGEVILPTPEEYEEQKRVAAEKRAERRRLLENQQTNNNTSKDQKPSNDTNMVPPRGNTPMDYDDDEPKMAEMPENAILRKGVVEQMSETTNVTPVSVTPRQNPEQMDVKPGTVRVLADTSPQEQLSGVSEGLKPAHPKAEQATEADAPAERAPLNLGEMEAELADAGITPGNKPHTNDAEKKEDAPVVIKVPEGQVDNMVRQLPLETYDKIINAKTIEIHEVELKDVPTATRQVTDIATYRAISQRRSNAKSGEITERALLNSGFIITLKSATSLEMSTIFKSMVSNDTDWAKMYQFAYEHTVSTSIGKLSYNDFISKVAPGDMETILDGIYEISEVDERKVQIQCGIRDGGCGSLHDVTIKVASLPCTDRLPQKSKDRVKELVDVKNDIFRAKEVQKKSPSSIVKVVEFGDRHLYVRSTTGHMMIERADIISEIGERYGGFMALLLLYVEKIVISYQIREDVPEETIELVTPDLICEELKTLDDTELEALKSLISDKLDDYEPVKYSLKGEIICPNCGLVQKEIECTISDLIFQKVQRMLE